VTAHAVREALRGGPSREAQLRTLADEARSQLWGFFQVGCEHSPHVCRDNEAFLSCIGKGCFLLRHWQLPAGPIYPSSSSNTQMSELTIMTPSMSVGSQQTGSSHHMRQPFGKWHIVTGATGVAIMTPQLCSGRR
jgi:hypothetical protein